MTGTERAADSETGSWTGDRRLPGRCQRKHRFGDLLVARDPGAVSQNAWRNDGVRRVTYRRVTGAAFRASALIAT